MRSPYSALFQTEIGDEGDVLAFDVGSYTKRHSVITSLLITETGKSQTVKVRLKPRGRCVAFEVRYVHTN